MTTTLWLNPSGLSGGISPPQIGVKKHINLFETQPSAGSIFSPHNNVKPEKVTSSSQASGNNLASQASGNNLILETEKSASPPEAANTQLQVLQKPALTSEISSLTVISPTQALIKSYNTEEDNLIVKGSTTRGLMAGMMIGSFISFTTVILFVALLATITNVPLPQPIVDHFGYKTPYQFISAYSSRLFKYTISVIEETERMLSTKQPKTKAGQKVLK